MTPPFTSIIFESIVLIPAGTDDRINNIPVTVVNILIKPVGVGLDQLDHALSMSNALIKNAAPRMLTSTANISAVYPKTVAIPQSIKEFLELLKRILNILYHKPSFLDIFQKLHRNTLHFYLLSLPLVVLILLVEHFE